ncbi:MAG: IS1096 element passenger TnpR family protein [Actinomycetota bacterium]
MSRAWLSIRVDLIEGRGLDFWPRPGRRFAAARTHTFAGLATAIDDAFARWDRSHLHAFELQDGTRIGSADPEGDETDGMLDSGRVKLARLTLGERFLYVYDFGDDWTHLCTVEDQRIDPVEALGIVPTKPLPYVGWGDIPDQYGRGWEDDDGSAAPPPDPGKSDLPPLRPWWGDSSQVPR